MTDLVIRLQNLPDGTALDWTAFKQLVSDVITCRNPPLLCLQ